MLLSLLLTALLLAFQTHVIRRTGSTAIRADSLHYRSDLLLNASILVALLLARYGWPQSDGLFGLGIALYILWSALQIARESVSILMDRELPTDISERMRELACSVPGVLGAHDVHADLRQPLVRPVAPRAARRAEPVGGPRPDRPRSAGDQARIPEGRGADPCRPAGSGRQGNRQLTL